MTTIQRSEGNGEGKRVRANGIDIHYVEAGQGEPLLLLHGGAVSTNPIWKGHPFAYVPHMGALAERFRVIAPDARGCGRTTHSGGSITFAQLADDAVALIEALGLDRPSICGFSEGGITATLVGIRNPGSIRAIVNDAGYDMFNPMSPSFAMMRNVFGGSPQATQTDLAAVERFFGSSPEMQMTLDLIKADQDAGQGPDYWKTYLTLAFDRTTQSPGTTFEDLRKVSAPMLVLTGDRDEFCTVEEGVTAYRMLKDGELAVLPGVGHVITPQKIQMTIDFLRRRGGAKASG